jgi:PAS domain S-box-containing protein
MTELPGYVLESSLREGGEFTVHRGRRRTDSFPVLVVAAAAEQPSPQSLRRLEHEFSLEADLDPAWAIRPLALTHYEGRTMLILEDPGGVPLDRILERGQGQLIELTRFLRIAVNLARALGEVHRHGFIHKDLHPANILVDDADNVRLTGFGIASRLPRERQAPLTPEVIAGTLPYMAPEQTGRMNRSIDSRSDLYALGITFYEMLTGTLPFEAADPMGWVHCHIARQPPPPNERLTAIPEALSAIVMTLLAKNAEDRYQTAGGLEVDLQRCLTEWQPHRRIVPFRLGTHDLSDRLMIPERLYGREREIQTLLAAFVRVVAYGTTELVLVSGYSGIGKSSVVNELHRVLVRPRGLFASGKFDQYQRDIPYATLGQAFQSLVRQMLGQSEAELDRWRGALSEALGANGQLIVNLVPELELVLGRQPPVPDLPPQDAQNRFQMVFRRFLGVFARQEHPLVLFLDDLQWLDTATLDLIEHLVTHSEVRCLLLVGAYRNNEVGPAHPLMRTLEAIGKAGARVHDIVLAPLGLDEVGRLVADAVQYEPELAQPLAQLVHEKTGGNPFFAIQFFTALAEEGLLEFDARTRAWEWDIDGIRAKNYTDNVVELMAAKLKRFSAATQEALKPFACLGNVVDIATLSLVFGESEKAIDTALLEAVRAGLVFRHENAYKFLHDRIQQAAYSLIPEEQRAEVHVRLGRVLRSRIKANELPEHLFDLANQFNRGAARLVERDERSQVATINLRAGRKAKASVAYASASAYFSAGMALLDDRDWGTQYGLTFSLWLERAECEFLTGHFEQAEKITVELLQRAASRVDQAAVYQMKVRLHTVKGEHPQAVDSALACLGLFGFDIPAHPTWEQVQAEHQTVWHTLNGRSIESLVDLPLMTDPELQAAMHVFSVLSVPAYFTDFRLYCLHLCRMANISMQHGTSGAAAHAYGNWATVLGPAFHRYREGYCFAKLACDLVEKHGFIGYHARALHLMGIVAFWTQPIATAMDFQRAAFRIETETGDLAYACYSAYHSVTALLLRNDPLDAVWRESERALDRARKAKFGDAADMIVSQQRFIATMLGQTTTFSTFSDAQFDESTFEAQLTGGGSLAIAAYWILKLKARFLSGDYAEALAAADKAKPHLAAAADLAKPLLSAAIVLIQLLDYFYYAALTVTALYKSASADKQAEWHDLLAAHLEQLREWVDNYPPTFGDKHALVSAEIARLEGRDADAMRLYEEAIRSAHEHGFVQNEGVAHEAAARFYAARGFETIAHAYLRNARHCYLRWGALGKVRQLDQRHPWFVEESARSARTTMIGAAVEQLDVGTVVKASHAVSGEIEIGKLIETLMRIAVEHAGAERGLLIIIRNDEPRIEAEARSGRGTVEVTLRQAAVTRSELPESVLHTVIRTRESVILDDASIQNPFSADGYIRDAHARSVLCLPMLKQGKLIGVLYLENNLTPHAFTSARLAVLNLLASQAAISLENALLYADLRLENSERKQAEDRLRRSEAYLARAQRLSLTGSFGWRPSSGEIYWSDETFRIFEYGESTAPTLELLMQRIHPGNVADFRQVVERATRDAQDFSHEYRLRMPDGRIKHLYVVAHAVRDESGSLEYIGAVMDVTERKQAEEALTQGQKRFRAMVEKSAEGIVLGTPEKGVIYASPSVERVLGYTPDEFAGRSLYGAVHTDHGQHMADTIAELLAEPNKVVIDEVMLLHKDRSWRTIECTMRNLMHEPSVQAVVINFRDITERKHAQAERELLGQRLRQAEKMESVGRLAAGIAHDFNNVLAGVFAYGEMIVEETSERSPLKRYAQNVLTAATRGRALIEQILAYSRSQRGKRAPIDIGPVVAETLELLRGSLPAAIRLEASAPQWPLVVIGDATQLHQVVMNLCSNAIQATSAGGTLRVALDAVELPAEQALSNGTLRPGHYVRLSVEDSGSGMEAATLARIFEPFFTTKEIGRGTGLGLSLVHAIVTDAGGAIDVRSVLEQGSTFTIYLPRAQGAPVTAEEAETPLPRGNGERVLLVDDDANVLEMTAQVLSRLGYEPVSFSDSHAALAAFEGAPRSFDVVVADYVMPGLTGTELASVLRRQRRELPIVLVSGYSGPILAQRALAAGVSELLVKPLQSRDIAAALARVLHLAQ